MTFQGKGAFKGLLTAIAETQAPEGALRVADNVVIRRPASVETRQGFTPVSPGYSGTGITFRDAAVHAGSTIYWDGTNWRSSAGTARTNKLYFGGSDVVPTKLRADAFSYALLRGNMYVPYANGVLCAHTPAEAPYWSFSGMPVVAAVYVAATGAGSALANGFQWGYRVVPKRVDANGVVVRGRPSAVAIYKNTTGGAVGVQVGLTYTPDPIGIMPPEVEVYRTRAFPNASAIDDEMALVTTLSTAGTGGTQIYLDTIADSARGQALYTSPSRGGAECSNDTPPACAAIEAYKGCLFFGNIVGSQRYTVSVNYALRTGSATGFGYRVATGDTTNLSPTILNVTPTAGVKVGAMVAVGATISRVLSVVGTTVTMTSNAAATTVGASISFFDAFEIDGVSYGVIGTDVSSAFPYYLSLLQTQDRFFAYGISPPLPGYTHTWVIEDTVRNTAAFTMRATNGASVYPPLAEPGGTAVNSSMDTYPNGLIYSNPDEPEHVPPKNFVLIGDKTKAILGLKSTRDSLFIFKEDGIYRLSGVNGQWRIDPFDLTTYCLLPSSIQKLNNAIYMLSNKGIVRVTEGGVDVVSYAIADITRQLIDDIRVNFASLGYYKLSGLDGCASCLDDRNSEYLLGLGSNVLECGGNTLVYNALTDAWTTFSYVSTGTLGFTAAGYGVYQDGSPMVLHTNGVRKSDYSLMSICGDANARCAHDGSTALTATGTASSGGAVIGLTYSGAHGGSVGDVVTRGSNAWLVESVPGANQTNLVRHLSDANDPVPTTGAATLYRAVTALVQPHGFYTPSDPSKNWTHAAYAFSRCLGPTALKGKYSSAESGALESSQQTTEELKYFRTDGMCNAHLGDRYVQAIPVRYKRGWLLRVAVTWTMHAGKVSLELMTADARLGSPARPQVDAT